MTKSRQIYGWVNGEAVYSNEEFRYKARGFGAITNDDDLMAYAEKVTYGWNHAMLHLCFLRRARHEKHTGI